MTSHLTLQYILKVTNLFRKKMYQRVYRPLNAEATTALTYMSIPFCTLQDFFLTWTLLHTVTGRACSFIYLNNISLHGYVPKHRKPVFSCWTFRLFPVSCYYEQSYSGQSFHTHSFAYVVL